MRTRTVFKKLEFFRLNASLQVHKEHNFDFRSWTIVSCPGKSCAERTILPMLRNSSVTLRQVFLTEKQDTGRWKPLNALTGSFFRICVLCAH